ncbi:MAG TPA: hypothetical protein DCG19_12740 [Cryomorphaceae bacterium]|nr:hypothetical protein [Owenweeksia sp.]HAD98269.1 hypothetical protein [Cryomorphaceae bacterium]HBF19002.1 hypothetical protein [Cryomorphaceae bacterium]|tara:strand:- start:2570 stop:3820 length:1251 start_codon:yes stop_codon:yes gene_type:complete
MKKLKYAVIFLLVGHLATAQKDTLSNQQILALKAKPTEVGIHYELGGANSKVPFSSMLNLALSDFLEEDMKKDMVSKAAGGIRFGYSQELDISYEQPGFYILGAYKPGSYFSIENRLFTGARFTENAVALALFGNKQFADQTIDLGPSRYESWWYTNLKYRYEAVHDSLPYKVDVGIVIGHEYSSYNVSKAEIYTEPNGEYIDAALDYTLRETRSGNGIAFGGLGFATGFETSIPLKKKKYRLDIQLEDVGVIFWSGLQETRVDSSFRFQGAYFENIFDLNDSLVTSERERLQNGLFSNTRDAYTAFMPFHLSLRFAKACPNAKYLKELYGLVEYRYLTAYIPRLGVGSVWRFRENQKLRSELTYGGFNTVALGAAYELTLAGHYRIALGSQNLLAWALPGVFTGSSVGVGAYYIF